MLKELIQGKRLQHAESVIERSGNPKRVERAIRRVLTIGVSEERKTAFLLSTAINFHRPQAAILALDLLHAQKAVQTIEPLLDSFVVDGLGTHYLYSAELHAFRVAVDLLRSEESKQHGISEQLKDKMATIQTKLVNTFFDKLLSSNYVAYSHDNIKDALSYINPDWQL